MFKTLFLASAAIAVSGCVFAATHADAGAKVAVIESNAGVIRPGATWAFVLATSSPDARVANDIVQERLQRSVAEALSAHGLRETPDPASAQLLVAYHVRVENRVEPRDQPCGGPLCWTRDAGVERYTEGLLVLDIADASTGRLVWRATSEKRVDAKDAKPEQLNRLLAEMTRKLPRT